jgi:peroxiredoxin-like protein
MASTHEYPVSVEWQGGRDGAGSIKSGRFGQEFKLSVPPEFQGPGDGTNPEELLTSAIAGCYTITFGIIAQNRKIPVQSIHAEAVGEVEQAGAQFTYKNVVIRPKIVLEAGASDDQVKLAEEMAHKADNYCIVTNALRGKVEISVEPEVTVG